MIKNKEYYLNCFKVSENDLRSLIAAALGSGGDYADLYFENTFYDNLLLRDGAVSSGGCHTDYGCGIRVLDGEHTGYAYSESTAMPLLMDAARAAGSIRGSAHLGIAGQARNDISSPWTPIQGLVRNDARLAEAIATSAANRYFGKPNPAADRYPVKEDWRGHDAAASIPWIENLEKKIRARDSRVAKVIALLSSSTADILMFNSFEELKYETRPLASLSLTVIFQQGGQTQTRNVGRSFRTGAEFLSESLQDELAELAVKGIDARFEAKRAKGGRMNVVMGAGASGILLHEAMGHAFEADFNRKGQSVFSEKMGRKICNAGINIVDDGTVPGNRGTINYDDEGVPGQKTYMVENGVLSSYLHDRISARFYDVAPTGNGRRESFRYHPIPRMRNTYMESGGDGSCEDIIASVKKGVYVDLFANGQVKIGEGDFTFFVKSGYLIENGRLTMPVKDINIIGNGPKALADIQAVGNDLAIDNGTWTCGKEQSVAVSCGIPTVLIKGLTVGGE